VHYRVIQMKKERVPVKPRQILEFIACFLALLTIAGILSGMSGCKDAKSSQTQSSGAVKVGIVGYINHEPFKDTVDRIKEVLAKYGAKIDVIWYDMDAPNGGVYAALNKLDAHMSIVINGKCTYGVKGKDVTFQWFEGEQWTAQDLDTVIAGLINK
jgi:hypothetical protein